MAAHPPYWVPLLMEICINLCMTWLLFYTFSFGNKDNGFVWIVLTFVNRPGCSAYVECTCPV